MNNVRNSFLLFIFCLFFSDTFTQTPKIQWTRSYGSSKTDRAFSICYAGDGNYMVLGYTYATDPFNGNVSNPKGGSDVWLLKIDSVGGIIWEKCFGGTLSDEGYSIKQTSDGGFIIGGSTDSQDGDVQGGTLGFYSKDYWIVKIDSSAEIIWQKCLGSFGEDYCFDIIQSNDGGYLAIGEIDGSRGDVSGFHGWIDIWVVKITSEGNKTWSRALGGGDIENAGACYQTTDGGYLIAGSAFTDDGDVTGVHSNGNEYDAWVVKLSATGQFQWQRCYGGSNNDEGYAIKPTLDGGFILFARSRSVDGDVTGLHNSFDYWVVKADSTGNIIWDKCIGGTAFQGLTSGNITSDGGIILIGTASSDDSIVQGTHGAFYDNWICKLDSGGNYNWGMVAGGSGDDVPKSVIETSDGGFIVVGWSNSTDGDHGLNHGVDDFWIVKFSPPGLAVSELENTLMELIIFQNHDQLNLRFFSKKNENAQLNFYDINGKKKFEKNIFINEGINYNTINCSGFAKGMYFVKIDGRKGSLGEKVIIQSGP